MCNYVFQQIEITHGSGNWVVKAAMLLCHLEYKMDIHVLLNVLYMWLKTGHVLVHSVHLDLAFLVGEEVLGHSSK